MAICLERGADLHMAQLIPLPLTVSCSSKIQIGFTFVVPAHLGCPGQRAVKLVCVCVLLYPKRTLKLRFFTIVDVVYTQGDSDAISFLIYASWFFRHHLAGKTLKIVCT